MKKILGLFVVMFLTIVLSLGNVEVSNITDQLKFSSTLGNGIKFDKFYDEEENINYVLLTLLVDENINYVLLTLLVDENSINTILGQKPGVGGELLE